MAVDFNGTTSKLENTSATPVDSDTLTIVAWVLADGQGEGGFGRIIQCDETSNAGINGGNGFTLHHNNVASVLRFSLTYTSGAGFWTFPATDGQWNAVALSIDSSAPSNDPVARVNFAGVTVTETTAPSGSRAAQLAGYCIGNRTGQDRSWDGALAHIQLFNVILSAEEMDAALRRPGSIRRGLTAHWPLWDSAWTTELVGGGTLNGTGTSLGTRSSGPPTQMLWPSPAGWYGTTAPTGGTSPRLIDVGDDLTVSESQSIDRTAGTAIVITTQIESVTVTDVPTIRLKGTIGNNSSVTVTDTDSLQDVTITWTTGGADPDPRYDMYQVGLTAGSAGTTQSVIVAQTENNYTFEDVGKGTGPGRFNAWVRVSNTDESHLGPGEVQEFDLVVVPTVNITGSAVARDMALVSESVSLAFGLVTNISRSDSVTNTDTATLRMRLHTGTSADSIVNTEDVTISLSQLASLTTSVADTLTVSESVTLALNILTISVAHTITVTEGSGVDDGGSRAHTRDLTASVRRRRRFRR